MLSKKTEKALNDQIVMEAEASNYYLSIASWFEVNGFEGAARFFYLQTEEERMHMLKFFHYINVSGGKALTPAIGKPAGEHTSMPKIFEACLKREKAVTASIQNIADIAMKEKDYTTFNFLQFFISEQLEEENLF